LVAVAVLAAAFNPPARAESGAGGLDGEPGKVSAPASDSVADGDGIGPTVLGLVPAPRNSVGADGRFHHQVRVEVPAFHGLEPEVGLDYSSAAGAGLAGWGWQLVGDSTIQRTARGRGAPAGNGVDEFVLDGERLIPCANQVVKGPSCIAGGTHSTERETFKRIRQEGTIFWDVTSREGVRTRYADASPVSAPGTVWAVEERVSPHGDRVTYERRCDGVDACYLAAIEYHDTSDPTHRTRVEFTYEPRPDPISFGAGAAVVHVRWRLATIVVRVGPDVARALRLDYHKTMVTARPSQLWKATLFGSDAILDAGGHVVGGTSLPPEVFSPVDSGAAITAEVSSSELGHSLAVAGSGSRAYGSWRYPTDIRYEDVYPGEQQWLTLDIDGDGRTDWVGTERWKCTSGECVQLNPVLVDGYRHVAPASAVPTSWPADMVHHSGSPRSAQPLLYRLVPADPNGDGKTDLINVWWDDTTSRLLVEVAIGNGQGGFKQLGSTPVAGVGEWNDESRWMTGDVNGDGLDDLVGVERVDANTGVSFDHAALIVGFGQADGRIASFVRTETDWRFGPADSPHWFVGESNGDGMADILRVETLAANAQYAYLHAGLGTAVSNGYGHFTLSTQVTDTPILSFVYPTRYGYAPLGSDLVQSGDFDGNGRTDLLITGFAEDEEYVPYTYVTFTVALANDLGRYELVESRNKVDANRQNVYQSVVTGSNTFPNRWFAGDVDGDRMTDLVVVLPATYDRSQYPVDMYVIRLTANGDGTFSDNPKKYEQNSTSLPYDCWVSTAAACGSGTMFEVSPGDANGDGRIDVMYAGLDDPGTTLLAAVVSPNTSKDVDRWRVTDVTGDGRPDAVYVEFTNNHTDLGFDQWAPNLKVYTSISDPSHPGGRRPVTFPVPGSNGFDDADMTRWLAIDVGSPVDGRPDGRADLVHVRRQRLFGTRFSTIATVLLSNGDGTFVYKSTTIGSDVNVDHRAWLPVELDGDGRMDLVRTGPATGGVRVEMLQSRGDGTFNRATTDVTVNGTTVVAARRFAPADVNGDGLTDLVHVERASAPTTTPPVERVVTLLREPGGWSARSASLTTSGGAVTRWQPAELNGDGRVDLVRTRLTSVASSGAITVGLRIDRLHSAGRGQWELLTSAGHGIGLHGSRWLALDGDGDGLDDLVNVASNLNNSITVNWVHNRGNDFAWVDRLTTPSTDRNVGAWTPASLTGDGRDGLVRVDIHDGTVSVSQFQTPWPRPLLRSLGSSHGLGTRVAYGTAAGSHDRMPLDATAVVVQSLQHTTLGSSLASPNHGDITNYTYSGARYDYTLARPLGFTTVTTTKGLRVTTTTYQTTPACAGTAITVEVRSALGGVLWRDHTKLNDPGPSAKPPWQCQPLENTRDECEQTSTCRVVLARRQYDQWGNVTRLDEFGTFVDADKNGIDDHDADNRSTVSTYLPNVSGYLVSYRASTTTLDAGGGTVADTITYYDGSTTPQPPTRGDATTTKQLESKTGRYLATTRTHDPHGNITSETDPAGRTTTTDWDATYGRFPVEVCNPVGCTTHEWDLITGRRTLDVDVNQQPTTHNYDRLGRHNRTTYADGGCLTHEYLDWGDPRAQRVLEGSCVVANADNTSQMVWVIRYVDGLGRVYREDRSGGTTRSRLFRDDTDRVVKEGQLKRPTDKNQFTSFYYDVADRVVDVVRTDQSVATRRYGVGSIEIADETGVGRTEHRDGLGRLTAVDEGRTNPAVTTTYRHDPLDRLIEVIDPAGNTSSWDVTSLGWQVGTCDPDRGCRSYEYDDSGLVERVVDAKGQNVEYAYDSAGRRVGQTDRDATGTVTDTRTWTFDVDSQGRTHGASIGRVVEATRGQQREEVWYDLVGRRTLVRHCVSNRCASDRTTWDVAGRIAVVEYPDANGDVSSSSEQVAHYYDAAGHLVQVAGYVHDVDYTPDDRVETISYANGTIETVGHDPLRQWTTTITVDGPTGRMFDTTYLYDSHGRFTGEDRAKGLGSGSLRYHYDNVGRLTDGAGQGFTYDDLGNLTSRSRLGDYQYKDPAHVHAATHDGTTAIAYDDNGNMTDHGPDHYTWSATDELTEVHTAIGVVRLAYDAAGQRALKETPTGLTTYHGRYTEIGPKGDITRSYYLGDRLVARTNHSWATRYYHTDRLGSPAVITDGQGAIVDLVEFDAFGNRTSLNGVSDDIGPSGHRVDLETGLVDYGARIYNPKLGRFLSADSVIPDITDPQSLNRYSYLRNDPLNRIDPDGHADKEVEGNDVGIAAAPRSARLLTLDDLATSTSAEPAAVAALAGPSPVPPEIDLAHKAHMVFQFVKTLLSPVGDRGKGFGVNIGAVSCIVACIAAGDATAGIYLSRAGPNDLLFGTAHVFGSVGGASFMTPGSSGMEMAPGIGVAYGVALQGFITEAGTAADFSGWTRGFDVAVGPVGAEVGINPSGQQSWTFGPSYGAGLGVWSYNKYTWISDPIY
jgi:RHS repeat-associated protein